MDGLENDGTAVNELSMSIHVKNVQVNPVPHCVQVAEQNTSRDILLSYFHVGCEQLFHRFCLAKQCIDFFSM